MHVPFYLRAVTNIEWLQWSMAFSRRIFASLGAFFPIVRFPFKVETPAFAGVFDVLQAASQRRTPFDLLAASATLSGLLPFFAPNPPQFFGLFFKFSHFPHKKDAPTGTPFLFFG